MYQVQECTAKSPWFTVRTCSTLEEAKEWRKVIGYRWTRIMHKGKKVTD